MLKIASVVITIVLILLGLLFVRQWNASTPWGTGTGNINASSQRGG